jgi:lysozyme
MADVLGVDVSHHNGQIRWRAVAEHVSFAWLRTGDGVKPDRRFAENWSGARAAGMLRGAYHFFRLALDPVAQADRLCDALLGLEPLPLPPGILPPVCDIESGGEGLTKAERARRVNTFCERAWERTGLAPLLYTMAGWWSGAIGGLPEGLDRFALWVADTRGKPAPMLPAGWGEWLVWQYSWSGAVPGIPTPCDLNRWNGSLEDLRWFARLAPEGGTDGRV